MKSMRIHFPALLGGQLLCDRTALCKAGRHLNEAYNRGSASAQKLNCPSVWTLILLRIHIWLFFFFHTESCQAFKNGSVDLKKTSVSKTKILGPWIKQPERCWVYFVTSVRENFLKSVLFAAAFQKEELFKTLISVASTGRTETGIIV